MRHLFEILLVIIALEIFSFLKNYILLIFFSLIILKIKNL